MTQQQLEPAPATKALRIAFRDAMDAVDIADAIGGNSRVSAYGALMHAWRAWVTHLDTLDARERAAVTLWWAERGAK